VNASFLAAVDDGGEWLVVVGERCGLRRAAGLAVELCASAPGAVELALAPSFHGGAAWCVTTGGGGPRPLADGARLELGPRTGVVFRRPDEASASAVLELQNGLEAAGASRVLLWVPGAGGRVRLGVDRRAHVRLPAEAGDTAHEWQASPRDGLSLGGVRVGLPLTAAVEVPLGAGRRVLLSPHRPPAG